MLISWWQVHRVSDIGFFGYQVKERAAARPPYQVSAVDESSKRRPLGQKLK